MKTRSNRLAQIRQQIESKGYTLDYTETDGAKVYKNDEFIHVPEFDGLLLEYEQLRIEQDANTSDWDGSTKNGIYFLVADSVSGDNSNLFKEYQKALDFYNDDEDGADGEYHVQLSAVYVEDGEIIESIEIKSKLVRDNKTVYQTA